MEEHEKVEGTETQYGECKFCHQMHAFNTIGMAKDADLDEWATDKCNCEQAKERRETKKSEERTLKNIENLFGNYDGAEILKAAVHPIAIDAVDAVTVTISNIKAEMKKKGNKVQLKKRTISTNTLEG